LLAVAQPTGRQTKSRRDNRAAFRLHREQGVR
jgi:hypothetical protein